MRVYVPVISLVVCLALGLQRYHNSCHAQQSSAQSSASTYYSSNGYQPRYTNYNQGYNRGYNSYGGTYNVCPGDSDLVTNFANTYYWKWFNDPILPTALSIDGITPEEAADINVKLIYESDQIDEQEKQTLAEIEYRAIRDNFGRATLQSLVYLYGVNIGEYLQLNGVLTRENTPGLVDQAVQFMDKAIRSSNDTSPKGGLEAASTGFGMFLASLGQMSKDKFPVLVTLYANNFYRLL